MTNFSYISSRPDLDVLEERRATLFRCEEKGMVDQKTREEDPSRSALGCVYQIMIMIMRGYNMIMR